LKTEWNVLGTTGYRRRESRSTYLVPSNPTFKLRAKYLEWQAGRQAANQAQPMLIAKSQSISYLTSGGTRAIKLGGYGQARHKHRNRVTQKVRGKPG